jgi:hypothetical protein
MLLKRLKELEKESAAQTRASRRDVGQVDSQGSVGALGKRVGPPQRRQPLTRMRQTLGEENLQVSERGA